jgi:hypothetical protein
MWSSQTATKRLFMSVMPACHTDTHTAQLHVCMHQLLAARPLFSVFVGVVVLRRRIVRTAVTCCLACMPWPSAGCSRASWVRSGSSQVQ